MARFVEQRKIEATAEEIEAFRKNARERAARRTRETEGRLAKVTEQLASAELPDADRAKLEKQRATLERQLARSPERA